MNLKSQTHNSSLTINVFVRFSENLCVVPTVENAVVGTNQAVKLIQTAMNVTCNNGYVIQGSNSQETYVTLVCQDNQTYGLLPVCEGKSPS